MGFFGVPLSGLVASEDQLQTVSNNLANLNTVGYKDQNTSFGDLFAQSSALNGIGDPIQTGLGVVVSQTVSNFTNGSPTATGIPSNMALTGGGFFVTQSSSGATQYTRAGNFTTNSQGQLTDPNGDLVMGYPAVNGVINTGSPLVPLTVTQDTIFPASPTTSFNFALNLTAAASTTGTASSFSNTTGVFDSLGNQQELTINYANTGPNTWSYNVTVPTSAVTAGGTGATTVASGTMSFSSTGQLTGVLPAGATTPVVGSIPIAIPTLADGAAALNMSWNLKDAAGTPTITQTNAASGISSLTQNGYASGTPSEYSVSANGVIESSFSNGQTIAIGQVALANFVNPQGLTQASGNSFQATYAAGPPQIGTAGSGSLGKITGGSVEGSNVDVATEFGKMIVAQQAYQANAKTVTTMDQLVQTTMQMLAG